MKSKNFIIFGIGTIGGSVFIISKMLASERMRKAFVDYDKLLEKAYRLYKTDWCAQHDILNADIDKESGPCYVCMGEFEDIEFQDEEYMTYLLSPNDLVTWKHFMKK